METIKVSQLEYEALQKYTDHAKDYTVWGLISRLREGALGGDEHFTSAERQALMKFINVHGLAKFEIAYSLAIDNEIDDNYRLEVEQPFQVGGWVVNTEREEIGKILSVHGMNRIKSDAVPELLTPTKHFRHATDEEIVQEQERRKWAAIGREVGEYKNGDIAKYDDGGGLIYYGYIFAGTHYYSVMSEPGDVLMSVNEHAGADAYLTLITPVEQRFDKETEA